MIELRNVSKTVLSGNSPLTIVQPLDLTVSSGQYVSIVGPSGSGKSTLLGLIAGLDAPTTGEIVIDGVEVSGLDEDALARLRGRKIGIVFQFFHLVPSLTAFENVLVPLEIAGVAQGRPIGPRPCCPRWASRAGPGTIPPSSRAASSSGSRSPAPSPTTRPSSSRTSPRATWTVPTDATSSSCSTG